MAQQTELFEGVSIEDVAHEVIRRIGLKEATYALAVSLPHLSNVLANRDNKRIPAKWLPMLDAVDPEHRIATFFAARLGCRLVEVPDVRTPEEQLRDLKAVLGRQGETGQNIMRAAGLRP